jgi:UDP-N-acetylglucosamine 2-epimerase (non-hydrolysing)
MMVVGARPNFMKAAPVVRALRDSGARVQLVHTGQHYDREMSEVFVSQLGMPSPDAFLGIGSATHGLQTARALEGIERLLLEDRPGMVVVPGDVNSTLAGALAAVKLDIPVCHLEAGLRSGDRSMPEEHNRVVTDHLSSLLLVHSESAIANLAREAITENVFNVGNTMIDTLLEHLEAAHETRSWERYGLKPGSYALVTLHRPALVDDPRALARTIGALRELTSQMPVVFPVHPRTRARIEEASLMDMAAEVIITAPLGYLEFLGLQSKARVVITDSGGVQEETSALGVRCFTLRDTTERPVTVELGTNAVIGARPERIAEIPSLMAVETKSSPIPLWDGEAGVRAAERILAAVAPV